MEQLIQVVSLSEADGGRSEAAENGDTKRPQVQNESSDNLRGGMTYRDYPRRLWRRDVSHSLLI